MTKKITKAIIPVAGLGTRFLPATKAQPKEMLSLVDKPTIQFLVEEAVASGITDITFVTGKGKRAIEDHFDYAPHLEESLRKKGRHEEVKQIRDISELAHFSYVRQREPKGDGDAILTAAHLMGDEPVAVLFGDDLVAGETPALKQLMQVYEKYGKPVVALAQVATEKLSRFGIAGGKTLGKRLVQIDRIVEKPKPKDAPSNLAIIGKYIITSEVLLELRKIQTKEGEELRLAHALDATAKKGDVYGLQVEGEWLDCGSKLGFLKATVHFGLKHPETKKEFGEFLKTLKN